ncbi:vacuolar amino acid permease [Coprinopsis sp. MPI-PUGE-AT-0042]|nr:vacuolar amino acid permease [Coprinopsis sp. MPI-PUGE-AT-0042]
MSSRSRPPSIETTSLLSDPPPSYRSTDDVSQPATPRSEDVVIATPKYSNADMYWMLAGLWAGVFLGAFDGTVVATLLTPIGSEFNASNQASYIGTSYLLSVCCFTPLYGRLADILGRKGAMLLALTLFGTGTIFCGAAGSMNALLVARAIAGMGGGGVMTVSSVAVTDLIPLEKRGIYQGIANVLYGLGAAIGGPLGGWINDNFGWRFAFFMQAPFFVFAIAVVALKVDIELSEEVRCQTLASKVARIDFLGSVTLVIAVASFLLGVNMKTTEELPWKSPILVGLLACSTASAIGFILVEKYWAPHPVMPMRLMTRRTPLVTSIGNLLASMSAFSMLYNAPLYFTAVRERHAAAAGLYMLPHSFAIPVGSLLAGWYMRRTGKLYGLTLYSALSTILASLLASCWTERTPSFHFWLDLIPSGFGMAGFITATLIAMITSVSKEDMAVATGTKVSYLFRTTGQVLGVSLSGALLQGVLLSKLKERIGGPNASEIIDSIRRSASSIPTLEPSVRRAAIASYSDALRVVFICQTAISALAFIFSLPIQVSTFSQPRPPPPEASEESSG